MFVENASFWNYNYVKYKRKENQHCSTTTKTTKITTKKGKTYKVDKRKKKYPYT